MNSVAVEEHVRQKLDTPTLTGAVKALRLALGDTQQKFANRLGIAISTAVRYESTRPPSGEILSKLYWLAVNNGLVDVAEMFHRAVFEGWREWARVPDSGQVAETLDQRFAQMLASRLVPRGSAFSVAEWAFMRSAQKLLIEEEYKHIRARFAELVSPLRDDLLAEAKAIAETMMADAPAAEDLMQTLMVRFIQSFPSELQPTGKATKAGKKRK